MRQMLLPIVFAVSALLSVSARAQAEGEGEAEAAWPDRVVAIEDMRVVKRMVIQVPRSRPEGDVKRPAVLRVHVGPEGDVKRVVLLESCGSPGHDSAAVRTMKHTRFKPYVVDGAPADVTLVVPMHLPIKQAGA